MPDADSHLYKTVQSVINELRLVFDGAPTFAPHITITSDILLSPEHPQADIGNILDRSLAVTRSLPGFEVIFRQVLSGDMQFKKLYISVLASPELVSLAKTCREEFVLRSLHRAKKLEAIADGQHELTSEQEREAAHEAAQAAGVWAKKEFDPHMSLVYTKTNPVEEYIMEQVKSRLRDELGEDWATQATGWTGGRLQLVRCEGPVEDWEVLGHRDITALASL